MANIFEIALAGAGAAPGAFYSEIEEFVGLTDEQTALEVLSQIVNGNQTDTQWAQKLVNNVVGNVVGDSEKASLVLEILAFKADSGLGRGEIASLLIDLVNSLDPNVAPWGAVKTQWDHRLQVAEALNANLDEVSNAGDLAVLQAFMAGVTADPATVVAALQSIENGVLVPGPDGSGQTYNLTVNQDTLTGTAGNDTFVGGAAQDGNGSLINTLQSVDELNGGDGVDTLRFTEAEGATVTPSMSSIEVIQARFTHSSGNGELDLSSSTGVERIVVSGSTADGTVSGIGAAADLTVQNDMAGNSVYLEDGTATALNLTIANFGNTNPDNLVQGYINVNDNNVTSAALALTNANVELHFHGTLTGFTEMSIAATGTNILDTTGESDAYVKTLTVTGAGSVDFDGNDWDVLETLSAGTATGSLTNIRLESAATSVTLGSGDDSVTFDTAVAATAVINLGAGDDTLNVGSAGIAAGASIDAGDGEDTLAIEHAQWALVDAFSAANKAKLTGFERLSITDVLADTDTVDMSSINTLTTFITAGVATGGTATVSELDSGETVIMNGDLATNNGTLVIEVADAADDDAAVLNLTVADTVDDGTGATVTVTAEEVETINFDATGEDEDTDSEITLVLTNDQLVTLNISGNDSVSFTAASTMADLATIDASANTAGVEIDVQNVANVVVIGTAEDDAIYVGNFATVTGGDGDDAFYIGIPTNGNSYSTIVDFAGGDTLHFIDTGDASGSDLSSMITLNDTAAFNDFLEAATAGDGSTDGIVSWFQFQGNTYVVQDCSNATVFDAGTDQIIKLTGLIDLSDYTVSNTGVVSLAV